MTTIEIAGQLTAGDRYRLLNCSSKEAELKSGTSRREFVKGAKPPAAAGRMSLEPKLSASRFQCFWPAPGAWGSFELTRNALTLTPLVGTIQLKELTIAPFLPGAQGKVKVTSGAKEIAHRAAPHGNGITIQFPAAAEADPDQPLRVQA